MGTRRKYDSLEKEVIRVQQHTELGQPPGQSCNMPHCSLESHMTLHGVGSLAQLTQNTLGVLDVLVVRETDQDMARPCRGFSPLSLCHVQHVLSIMSKVSLQKDTELEDKGRWQN